MFPKNCPPPRQPRRFGDCGPGSPTLVSTLQHRPTLLGGWSAVHFSNPTDPVSHLQFHTSRSRHQGERMTGTIERTARSTVQEWLTSFETALTADDLDSAAALFLDDSYWRDLVAFTWNIVTVEGPDGVRDLLESNAERMQPSGFAVAEHLGEPTTGGGVTESWIQFETAVGRCIGHLR